MFKFKKKIIKSHICHESKTCCCSLQVLEPDEECPVHGWGEYPPRCEICGRFVKIKSLEIEVI